MHTQQPGFIKLWIGPMFAEKTSSMMREIRKYTIANKLCVCVKYTGDNRYSTRSIIAHSGDELHNVPIVRTHSLADVFDEISEYEVIGVDEVQFYPDAVEILHSLACQGKIILASGLDADFMARPFGRVHELAAKSENVIKLKAICMRCCADASFTMRVSDETELEVIGGADKYIAVCRQCMFNPTLNAQPTQASTTTQK